MAAPQGRAGDDATVNGIDEDLDLFASGHDAERILV
jgi:hypothetical protein